MGISLSREIRYGWMACLIGTAAMDAVVILENAMTGQPVDTSFVLFGQLVGGGVIAGFFIHILFGSALGIAISRIDALRIDSTAKGLKVGIAAGLRHGGCEESSQVWIPGFGVSSALRHV